MSVTELLCELTKRCNLHCPYCYCVWHENPEVAPREMPIREWKKVVTAFARSGGKSIMFTGGEVLLKRGFDDLLRHTAQTTLLRTIVFTNALRVTEEHLTLFKESGTTLGVSLQGLQSYGASTGSRRTYHKVLEVMMRANEMGIPLSVSTTVTRLNVAEIEEIIAAALLADAQMISVMPFMYEGLGNAHPDLGLPFGEWTKLVQTLRGKTHADTRIVYGNEFFCACRETPLPFTPEVPKGSHTAEGCQAGKTYCVCGPSGGIRKCLHTHRNIAFWRDYFNA